MGCGHHGKARQFSWLDEAISLLALLYLTKFPFSLFSSPLQPKNYKGVRYHKERHQWQAYILDDDQVWNV